MKKMSVLALIAAFAIPVGIVGTESVASAAPIAPERVASAAKQIVQQAWAIHNEALANHKAGEESLKLAHEQISRSNLMRLHSNIVLRDGYFLMQDDKAWGAARECMNAHHEFSYARKEEHIFLSETHLKNNHLAAAAHDEAEATRLKGLAAAETDPKAKAAMNDAATDVTAAAARNRADAAKHATNATAARSAADRYSADARRKENDANRIVPASCSLTRVYH